MERQYGTSLSKISSALKVCQAPALIPFHILDNRAERFGSEKWVCAMVPPLDVLAIENGESKWRRGPGS